MTKRIIVIGNGMVGYKFCEKLRAKADATQFEILVFGEEPRPAYDRVHLSAYFTDSTEDDLRLAPQEWYARQDIELHLGTLVKSIDRATKTILTHKEETFSYDYLVLATGSYPFVPPIEGRDKNGVFVYRTIEDLDQMLDYGKKLATKETAKAAVLGGGLLGLEAAKAVMDMGLETHVIEFAPWLMPRQLDEQGGQVLKEKMESLGVHIHTNKNTTLIGGNGSIS